MERNWLEEVVVAVGERSGWSRSRLSIVYWYFMITELAKTAGILNIPRELSLVFRI